MKKGESSRFSNDNKNQRESSPKDEDCISQRPSSVIEEIKMIIGGPSTGGSFKPLKKACQRQVNNVHKMPPFKQKQTNRDISFSEEDARVVK